MDLPGQSGCMRVEDEEFEQRQWARKGFEIRIGDVEPTIDAEEGQIRVARELQEGSGGHGPPVRIDMAIVVVHNLLGAGWI